MQQYRIIALDLDGTLTDSEKKITPKTKEALHSLIRKGVRLVPVSYTHLDVYKRQANPGEFPPFPLPSGSSVPRG